MKYFLEKKCACVYVYVRVHTHIYKRGQCNVSPKAISPKGVADAYSSRVLGGDTDAQVFLEKVMLGREHEDLGTVRASEHLGGFGLQ